MSESTGEVWRDIPGYEGLYMASNRGSVRSLDRVVRTSRGTRVHRGKVLRQHQHPRGYMMVTLCSGGTPETQAVHRLVVRAFLGLPEGDMQTCHNDGDPSNNSIGNLRYDTTINNHADKRRHGTLQLGEGCVWAKATDESVIAMRTRREAGEPLPSLAEEYGISKSSISRICRGEQWAHVGGPISKIYSRS